MQQRKTADSANSPWGCHYALQMQSVENFLRRHDDFAQIVEEWLLSQRIFLSKNRTGAASSWINTVNSLKWQMVRPIEGTLCELLYVLQQNTKRILQRRRQNDNRKTRVTEFRGRPEPLMSCRLSTANVSQIIISLSHFVAKTFPRTIYVSGSWTSFRVSWYRWDSLSQPVCTMSIVGLNCGLVN